MRQRLVARLLRHNMERIRAGDYRPTLRMDAKDVRFRSRATARGPARSMAKPSWSAGCSGSSMWASRSTPTRSW